MIDQVLDFLLEELNAFFTRRRESLGGPPVVLANIVDQEGAVQEAVNDRVILSLVNIEHESSARRTDFVTRSGDGSFAQGSPSLCLNLYLMVAVHFRDYKTGLLHLSNVIGFLQGKPVFTAQNAPAFPKGVEKVTFEMVSMNFQELSFLWGMLGAKYVPSIIYKVRMLTVQEAWMTEEVPPIQQADAAMTS